MIENKLIRSSITVLLFARVLWSYVWFGLITQTLTKDKKILREKLAKVHETNALRVYNAFSLLKGVYIKVGQFLSTQAFLPPQYIVQMLKMQDRVPTASTEAIHKRIQQQYGKPASEIFKEFDDEPLACASIGQVHRVVLKDGTEAVLKVKYPGIDGIFHSDLDLLKRMVPIFVAIVELAFYRERSGIEHSKTIGELVKYIRMELDYTNEVFNHKKMIKIMEDQEHVIVPRLHPELCTDATICMEYIDADRTHRFFADSHISDEAKNMAYERFAKCLLYQVTAYGFFQADTHGGNFLIEHKDGDPESVKVVMLDLGCAKQLPNEFRQGILQAVQGYINRDAQMSAQAYWDLGFRTKKQTLESLVLWADFVFGVVEQVLDHFNRGEPITNYVKENMAGLSEKGYELTQSDRIDYIPEEYIMFGRALATPPVPFEEFQPTADIMALVMPYMMHLTMPTKEVQLDP